MKSRLLSIYGNEALEKLEQSRVAVCGLGGVGSYCATSLARAGVGNLVIIDFDVIDKSNINRQQFAFTSTVGQYKVDVGEKILLDINPDSKITKFQEKIIRDNVDCLLQGCDFVVDCIDDVAAKIDIARYAQNVGIDFVSCMGTALRKDPSQLSFSKLYDTSICPLCRTVRQEARKEDLADFNVLFSIEPSLKSVDGKLGSTSYLPPIAGMMLAGFAIEKLIKG